MGIVTTSRKHGGKSAKGIAVAAVVALALLAVAFAVRSFGGGADSAPDAVPTPQEAGAAPAPQVVPAGGGNAAASERPVSPSQGARPEAEEDAGIAEEVADGTPPAAAEGGGWESAMARKKAAEAANPNLTYYVDEKPKEYFTNRVENLIERLTRQGARITETPRVNLSEEEILEFLRQPVDIYEDEDDETVAAKERTSLFKQEALAFIENGGTFNQFLRDLASEANELSATRKDVYDEAVRIADTQGREACEAYLMKVNPDLEAAGIKPVKFAPMFYQMRAKRLARQKELQKSKENQQ